MNQIIIVMMLILLIILDTRIFKNLIHKVQDFLYTPIGIYTPGVVVLHFLFIDSVMLEDIFIL